MTLGSLFDGIGGFPLAAERYGIKAIWASEIEPFPIKVTKLRFPSMKHYGDITKMDGASIEPVDIVSGGSPCQDLSVAGKRAGLEGERSGLFIEQVRIIREMRACYGDKPRYMVWENVPGAFSSSGGEDFRVVLEETVRIAESGVSIPRPADGSWATAGAILADRWSIAWRVLDAQFWGVPQRRRRIFLVADFGGQSAPEILFKPESVCGNIEKGRKQGEGAAEGTEGGIRTAGGSKVTSTLFASYGTKWNGNSGADTGDHFIAQRRVGTAGFKPAVAFACNQRDEVRLMGDKSGAIQAEPGMRQQTFVTQPITLQSAHSHAVLCLDDQRKEGAGLYEPKSALEENWIKAKVKNALRADASKSSHAVLCLNDQGGSVMDVSDVAGTLRSEMHGNIPAVTLQMRSGKEGGGKGPLTQIEQSATLGTGNTQTVFSPSSFGGCGQGCGPLRANGGDLGGGSEALVSGTVCAKRAKGSGGPAGDEVQNLTCSGYAVRRLTPTECERLQGFPDGWTDIEGATDTARYKALGNSVAIPCVEYVMRRIKEVS